MPGLSIGEIQKFTDGMHRESGQASHFTIEAMGGNKGRVRLHFQKQFLRLGGTISGPSLMRLVDAATYFTILGNVGAVYESVTANLNINFLRPASPGDVLAHVALLKIGRKLAFSEFRVTDEAEAIVAHGTCTFALPENAADARVPKAGPSASKP